MSMLIHKLWLLIRTAGPEIIKTAILIFKYSIYTKISETTVNMSLRNFDICELCPFLWEKAYLYFQRMSVFP